jgi:hypothetical protein
MRPPTMVFVLPGLLIWSMRNVEYVSDDPDPSEIDHRRNLNRFATTRYAHGS